MNTPEDFHKGTQPKHLHAGACSGVRGRCWRPECQRENADYRTVEFMTNGTIHAGCHGASYRNVCLELAAELFRHSGLEQEGVPWAA